MNSQQGSQRETQPDNHYPVEFLVLESGKERCEVVFRSPDDDEAVTQHIGLRRNGVDTQLAVTIPQEFCTRVDGFAVGLNKDLPLSFHLFLQAAEAAAARHGEATGETVDVEPAVAFIVPQSALSPLRSLEKKVLDSDQLQRSREPVVAVTPV